MRVAVLADSDRRLLRLAEEARIAEVRPEKKGVVGPLLRKPDADLHAALDLHLLLIRILLMLVTHVPAEGDPEFVNEVLPRLGLLILRGEIIRLPRPEVRDEGAHPLVAF